jgi:hypothetical protein
MRTNFHKASIERIDLLRRLVARAKYRPGSDSHKIAILLVQLDVPTLRSITSGYGEPVEVCKACKERSWDMAQSCSISIVQQPSDQRNNTNRNNREG